MTTKRNHLIDLLRFVAAIFVILDHFYMFNGAGTNNIYKNFFFDYGFYGVEIFFIISGYCIMIALQHASKPIEFIIRRMCRIFPPYWFSLIITLIVVLLFKLITGTNSVVTMPKTILDIVKTMLLLTHPFTSLMSINWVSWTLTLEVMFYIVIFLCSFLKAKAFIVSLILITVAVYFVPLVDHGFLLFFRNWPMFSLGLALFKLLHDGKKDRFFNISLFLLSAGAFFPTHHKIESYILCSIVIMLITVAHFKPLRDNMISRMGDYSYSIYLLHVPLIIYTVNSLRDRSPLKGSGLLDFLFDLILIAIIVFLSKLTHTYVEIPSINIGKKLSKKLL